MLVIVNASLVVCAVRFGRAVPENVVQDRDWQVDVPADWPVAKPEYPFFSQPLYQAVLESSCVYIKRQVLYDKQNELQYDCRIDRWGWPFRFAESQYFCKAIVPVATPQNGQIIWKDTSGLLYNGVRDLWGGPSELIVPTRIIWDGAIINILLFASFLYVAHFTCAWIVCKIRMYNQYCVHCNYCVSDMSTCPECGVYQNDNAVSLAIRKVLGLRLRRADAARCGGEQPQRVAK